MLLLRCCMVATIGLNEYCIKSETLENTNTPFTLEKTNIKYSTLYLY